MVLRFAIEVSFLEYEEPERLLPAGGGSKKSEESKKSSAYAPLGGMVSALNLRRVPTYSPTCGLFALETGELEKLQSDGSHQTLKPLTTH